MSLVQIENNLFYLLSLKKISFSYYLIDLISALHSLEGFFISYDRQPDSLTLTQCNYNGKFESLAIR